MERLLPPFFIKLSDTLQFGYRSHWQMFYFKIRIRIRYIIILAGQSGILVSDTGIHISGRPTSSVILEIYLKPDSNNWTPGDSHLMPE